MLRAVCMRDCMNVNVKGSRERSVSIPHHKDNQCPKLSDIFIFFLLQITFSGADSESNHSINYVASISLRTNPPDLHLSVPLSVQTPCMSSLEGSWVVRWINVQEKWRYGAQGGGVKRGPPWGKRDVCRGSRAHVHACPVLAPERPLTCCRCVCRSHPSCRPILRGRRRTRPHWLWWLCHHRSASGLLRSGWGLSHCLAAARGSAEHSDKSDMKGGGRDASTHT